jgi:hypothetical protein
MVTRWNGPKLGVLLALSLPVTGAFAGGGGYEPGIDAQLELPVGAVNFGAAYAVTIGGELLVGDPGMNTVTVYANANLGHDPYDIPSTSHVVLPGVVGDARAGEAIDTWEGLRFAGKSATSIALVGAPGDGNGRVYILQRPGEPGTAWSMTGWIEHDNPDWAGFGASIEISEPNVVLIGAPEGTAEGVAEYVIDGTSLNWVQDIDSPFPAGAGFGKAVAILVTGKGYASRALIGAPDMGLGQAVLFTRSSADSLWTMEYNFADSAPMRGGFGTAVALSHTHAYVSAPEAPNPNNMGVLWIFESTEVDPYTPGYTDLFAMPPLEVSGGRFGVSLFLFGNEVLFVGHTEMASLRSGVHVYAIHADSESNVAAWVDSVLLDSSDGSPSTWGRVVTGVGNMLWIGAENRSVGYLLNDGEIQTSSDVVAVASAQAIASDTNAIPQALDVEGDWMAAGVAADNQVVIMHADDAGAWSVHQIIDGGSGETLQFGLSVRLLNGVLAVGAPRQNANDGLVSLYTLDAKTNLWSLVTTISPPLTGGFFGFSVDMCLDQLDRLVLAVSTPEVDYDSFEKWTAPTALGPGRIDLYRIDAGATSVLALSHQTGSSSVDGLIGGRICADGPDLLIAAPRVLRGTVAGEPLPQTWGGASIYRTTSEVDADWVLEADIDAPESRGGFGVVVDITPGLFLATSPYRHPDIPDEEMDSRIDVFERFPKIGIWVVTQYIRTPDMHYRHSFGTSARIATLYGKQVILAGSPRLESTAGLAGAAEVFIRESTSYQVPFTHHLRLTVDGYHDVRLGSTVAMDDGHLFFAGGLFTGDDPLAGDGGLVAYANLSNTAYWNNLFGGRFEAESNWTVSPDEVDNFVISVLNPTLLLNAFGDLSFADRDIHVGYANTMFRTGEELAVPAEVRNWSVSADPAVQMALSGCSTALIVHGDLTIGADNGDAGRFWALEQCEIMVDGTFTQSASGALNWWFPGDSESAPLIDTTALELGGSLSVFLQDEDYPLHVGDTFPMLRAATTPAPDQNRFELIVLPGLPDGLAMQVMYDEEESLGDGTWDVWIEIVELGGLINFGDPNSATVDANAIALDIADLTNDGADEICVLLDGTPGQLMIFTNDGSGGVAQQVIVNTLDTPTCIASGDFDGDGFFDLAIGHTDGTVQLLWNDDGDPTDGFTTTTLTATGPVLCISRANIDGADPIDLLAGIDDTATPPDGSGTLQWWYALDTPLLMGGSGHKDTPGVPIIIDPSEEEGQKDFIAFIGFGNGTGGGANANLVASVPDLNVNVQAIGADPTDIELADIDGDGVVDALVTSRANGTVAILLGTGVPGVFNTAMHLPVGTQPTAVVAIDLGGAASLAGPGLPDMVFVVKDGDGNPIIRVLQNEGGLSFTAIDTADDEDTILLDAGDIDGDGVERLVSIGRAASFISETPMMFLHNVADCPGDTDGNGTVDIEDLLNVISDWGSDCSETACQGDADDNGTVNIEDLLVVIGNYGPC